MGITDDELVEIERACEAATMGPWFCKSATKVCAGKLVVARAASTDFDKWEQVEDNARLIALSRTALPKLVATWHQHRKMLRNAAEVVNEMSEECDSLKAQIEILAKHNAELSRDLIALGNKV